MSTASDGPWQSCSKRWRQRRPQCPTRMWSIASIRPPKLSCAQDRLFVRRAAALLMRLPMPLLAPRLHAPAAPLGARRHTAATRVFFLPMPAQPTRSQRAKRFFRTDRGSVAGLRYYPNARCTARCRSVSLKQLSHQSRTPSSVMRTTCASASRCKEWLANAVTGQHMYALHGTFNMHLRLSAQCGRIRP